VIVQETCRAEVTMFRTGRLAKPAGLLLLVMQGAALGCGDDGSGPVEDFPSSLVAVWDATRIELVSVADPP
jgi:hypothetical protein